MQPLLRLLFVRKQPDLGSPNQAVYIEFSVIYDFRNAFLQAHASSSGAFFPFWFPGFL